MEFSLFEALTELKKDPSGRSFTTRTLGEIVCAFEYFVNTDKQKEFETKAYALQNTTQQLRKDPSIYENMKESNKFSSLENYIKSLVAKLILEYYDPDYFNSWYYSEHDGQVVDTETLERSMNTFLNNAALCHLLDTIGHYQYSCHYFLSTNDWYAINIKYKDLINEINKNQIDKVNIFSARGRNLIDPKLYIKPSYHYVIYMLAQAVHNKEIVLELAQIYSKQITGLERLNEYDAEAYALVDDAARKGQMEILE